MMNSILDQMDRLDVIVDNKTFGKQKLSLLKNLERKQS